jgi:hypothetical protein
MITMNSNYAEKWMDQSLRWKGRSAIRKRDLRLVEQGLRSMAEILIPQFINSSKWSCSSGLKCRAKVFASPDFQLDLFSGKLVPPFQLLDVSPFHP